MNNSNIKKLNYVYSKKSMLERKQNQFNFPISKSNSYRKNCKSNKKINLSKSKEKGSQINMIPQMKKIVKIIKVREERNNSNENYSNNNSVRKIYYKGDVEKIKVNKNLYIN